jgi:hypothetical protein
MLRLSRIGNLSPLIAILALLISAIPIYANSVGTTLNVFTVGTTNNVFYVGTGSSPAPSSTPISQNYIGFDMVLSILPTFLFLGSLFLSGFMFFKAWRKHSRKENNTFEIVVGVLAIIVLVTMFVSIFQQIDAIRTLGG